MASGTPLPCGSIIQSHRRSGRLSESQGNGDVVTETATSLSGKQRRHRQGNGDVITVTSGIATISQQSDAFATMLEDRPKQHASAWGLRTKFVTMAAPRGASANRVGFP